MKALDYKINDKDGIGTAGILGQHIAFFSNIVIRIKRNAKASFQKHDFIILVPGLEESLFIR